MNIAIIHNNPDTLQLFKRIIEELGHNTIWHIDNLLQASQLCLSQKPDLLLLQLELDSVNCPSFIQDLISDSEITIIVTIQSQSDNTAAIFEAMSAGALDVITEPTCDQPRAIEDLRLKIQNIDKLLENITTASPARFTSRQQPPLIAIGSSTGGPAALLTILQSLPSDLHAVVVIIQHMDDHFSQGMAEWLNKQCEIDVSIATNFQQPEPAHVYMAGTNDHLIFNSLGQFEYTDEPLDYPYRPSVNSFYESALSHWPEKIVGVLLTGMGRDGADGLLSLYNRGMITIAQDESSSAVYGMPKAASELNAVTYQLDINDIAPCILKQL